MADWSLFKKRIPIQSDVSSIYNSWASQNGLESFFLRRASFHDSSGTPRKREELIQAGDEYFWLWHGYGDEVFEKGTVLSANGKDELSFTFSECSVTLKITPANALSVVELTQSDIPTDDKSKYNYHVGCAEGWTFYLANLKSILEGGIDLRNKDKQLTGVINA